MNWLPSTKVSLTSAAVVLHRSCAFVNAHQLLISYGFYLSDASLSRITAPIKAQACYLLPCMWVP